MGRTGGWGGREYGAEASLGRKGAWGGPGGSEYGAEASMGRKRVWGGREYGAQGAPRHTDLHFDPQATTFLSPPGGIYLIRPTNSSFFQLGFSTRNVCFVLIPLFFFLSSKFISKNNSDFQFLEFQLSKRSRNHEIIRKKKGFFLGILTSHKNNA
jgi:hypothetical protein